MILSTTADREFSIVSMMLAACLAIASCDEAPLEPAPREPADAVEAAPERPEADAWLAHDDPRSPGAWLAGRTAAIAAAAGEGQNAAAGEGPGGARDAGADRVARLDAGLDAAGAIFVETRRMLANRLGQLVDVTAEHGAPLPPERLLADLAIPDPAGGERWFGVIAQAYIELRRGGADHAAAVATLQHKFGRASGDQSGLGAAGETPPGPGAASGGGRIVP